MIQVGAKVPLPESEAPAPAPSRLRGWALSKLKALVKRLEP